MTQKQPHHGGGGSGGGVPDLEMQEGSPGHQKTILRLMPAFEDKDGRDRKEIVMSV